MLLHADDAVIDDSPNCHPLKLQMGLSELDPIRYMVPCKDPHESAPNGISIGRPLIKPFWRSSPQRLPVLFNRPGNLRYCPFNTLGI